MEKKKGFSYRCYRIIRWFVWLFYPRTKVVGAENLPERDAIVVGNHAQMNGPITAELYLPGDHDTWCAGQMMALKEVPDYAFADFWSGKPKSIRWFYRGLSYVIAPLSVCVFNNARTIPVYHDTRIVKTFKQTLAALDQGKNVVIFPEHYQPYNSIINDFQDRFIDIAKQYYKRTGRCLSFVPLYNAPRLQTMYLGAAIRYDPKQPPAAERQRIKQALMERITDLALSAPPHTVVPYANIPKKQYPRNILNEVSASHETTCD